MPGAPAAGTHLLSFDVEEYFHVEAAAAGLPRDAWETLPRRLPPAVDLILRMLADRGASATFFILGWVAERDPALVRRIAACGHEIASHGMGHRMVGQVGPEAFARDVGESRRLLEDLAGRPVLGYRAPTFSVTHNTAWALDVLVAQGYRYDSSVFPIRHDRYGVPEAPRWSHTAVGPGGARILEIPPLTLRLAGANWPVGGGGYLRLLPVRIVESALRRAERGGHAAMLYLHPWELDPGQPVLPMGRLSRWRHRVGLSRTQSKLGRLLDRFRFTSVAARLDSLLAAATEEHVYGKK
ncbi:MAG: DUF3473 domain-containing protein [Planctomycetes bacterium]|nr:DUF3473 domain-containing protein [Planctomycetota bacterium]